MLDMPRGYKRPVLDGLPLPYSGETDQHGVLAKDRQMECMDDGICGVCGQGLDNYVYMVVVVEPLDPDHAPGDVIDYIGMHKACASMTMRWCPHLRDNPDYFRVHRTTLHWYLRKYARGGRVR